MSLRELIFQHCDNLSPTLQTGDISATERQQIAAMACKTLVAMQSVSNFDLFWIKVNREAQTDSLSESRLPHNRASASVDHGDALKVHY